MPLLIYEPRHELRRFTSADIVQGSAIRMEADRENLQAGLDTLGIKSDDLPSPAGQRAGGGQYRLVADRWVSRRSYKVQGTRVLP